MSFHDRAKQHESHIRWVLYVGLIEIEHLANHGHDLFYENWWFRLYWQMRKSMFFLL